MLEELGLNEQEAKTYLALLKLGGSHASAVAKEVGVKRTTIYAILTALANKGAILVYFRKNNKFYYAQKPHKLRDLFENKLKMFDSMIPFLESMEKKEVRKIGLRFIETKEELEKFYDDIIVEYKNKEYYVIGNTQAWEAVSGDSFHRYRKDRVKNNVRTKLLLSHDSKIENFDVENGVREFRHLPEKYKFKGTINIFDDKILVVSPELTSLAVVIAIPAMVDVFQSVFEIIWDSVDSGK